MDFGFNATYGHMKPANEPTSPWPSEVLQNVAARAINVLQTETQSATTMPHTPPTISNDGAVHTFNLCCSIYIYIHLIYVQLKREMYRAYCINLASTYQMNPQIIEFAIYIENTLVQS